MTIRHLDTAFHPKSVGVLGTSGPDSRIARAILDNLLAGFSGPVTAIGAFGKAALPDSENLFIVPGTTDLDAAPDLVAIADLTSQLPQHIHDLGQRGTRALAFIGQLDESLAVGQAVLDAARPHLTRLIGPDSIGLIAPHAGLNASYAHLLPAKGDLALISQSNAIVTAVIDWAVTRDIGFSGIVGTGARLDVDTADLLDFFAADIHTRAILLHIEEIRDRTKFMSAARAAARSKPVILIKGGTSAERDGHRGSHASVLADEDTVYRAAFARAGLIHVADLDDLFDAAVTLSRVRPFHGDGVAVISNSSGVARLTADRVTRLQGRLADITVPGAQSTDTDAPSANPVDLGPHASPQAYADAVTACLDHRDVNAVLLINAPSPFVDETAVANAVVSAVAERKGRVWPAKPVFASWMGGASAQGGRDVLAEHGVPTFATPGDAAKGLMHLVTYQRGIDRLRRTPESLPRDFTVDTERAESLVQGALDEGREWLSANDAVGLLRAYDIPVTPCVHAMTPEAAESIAYTLLRDHSALVVKISGKDVRQKTDIGGVRLDLTTPEDVRRAAEEMFERAQRHGFDGAVDGVTLHPMVRRARARELILGLTDDPLFGPVVVFGQGGIAVELVHDKAVALPPLDLTLAGDLIAGTRVAEQLKAFRGAPAADRGAVALTLVKLGQLAADLPNVREIDINPMLADADGVIALDVRVRIARETRIDRHGVNPRFAVRPYPKHWERTLDLKQGRSVLVRPVRPEDEALYEDFFAHVTREDMRLRFFTPSPNLSHAFLARLTQIDYGRAMAFVALDPDSGDLLGVVRLHADADHRRGEYAILLQSHLKGLGLGWALMQLIIEYGRADGLAEVYGEVLSENTTMLDMCRSLGFAAVRNREDPAVTDVVFDLTADV